jgi:aspartate racemase
MIDILDVSANHLAQRQLSRVALFGTRFTIDSRLFGPLEAFDVVRPRDAEIDEIHRIYLRLATEGQISAEHVAKLRTPARTLEERDDVEAIMLAGTDLNLVFNESNAGFRAVDCAAAHIEAIVAQMSKQGAPTVPSLNATVDKL